MRPSTFWNPKVRRAECLNRQAARSIVPIAELRTRMVMAGHSKEIGEDLVLHLSANSPNFLQASAAGVEIHGRMASIGSEICRRTK